MPRKNATLRLSLETPSRARCEAAMPIENSRCCIRIGGRYAASCTASTVFFAAGATHMQRAILGGNRSGKSTCAAYELAAHLTGR
jgi:hypothetical protein